MNNIKWYYEAPSQRQLDELIVFLIDYGYKSKGNNYDDYEQGCFYIGITKDDETVYCTSAPNEYLIGKRTGDIEVFKSQFNSKEENEAEEPLVIRWEDGQCDVGNHDRAIWITARDLSCAKAGYALGIDTRYLDIKTHNENGCIYLTFHKKQS